MRLKHYIQGDKRGKEANRLERQAMNDPFLHDALDGFHAVPGDHADALGRLEKKVFLRSTARKRKQQIAWWSIAATVLLLIGLGGYFFMQNEENKAPVIATTQDTTPKEEESKDKVAEVAEQAEEHQKAAPKFVPPVIKPDEEVSEEEEIVTQQEVISNVAAVGAVNFDKGTDDITVPETVQITSIPQNQTITYGKVVDESGRPLTEATIFDKNPYKGTTTEQDGRFRLPVQKDTANQLTFGYIGYKNRSIKTNDSDMLIRLNPNKLALQEMAVSKSRSSVAPVYDSIQGRVAGLDVNRHYLFGKKQFITFCKDKAKKNICGGRDAFVKVTFFINKTGRPCNYDFKEFSCEQAKLEITRLLNTSPNWSKSNTEVTVKINL